LTERVTNWAGNVVFEAKAVHRPTSVDEVRRLVESGGPLRVLGSGHSFNRMADTPGGLIVLSDLPRIFEVSADRASVRIDGGVRYGELAPLLQAEGLALHNTASLPHISVAGAIATATHGSGALNANLATAVSSIELVTGSGDLVTISRDNPDFSGVVVHLGALGVIVALTLDVQPTFDVRQYVYDDVPRASIEASLLEMLADGYSVSLFTDWQKHRATQVWIKRRLAQGETHTTPELFYNAKRATRKLHPITEHPAESCTEQMGVPGPWYDRLPHFRMDFTPSSGRELQTEYFVPRQHGYEAILAVEKLKDKITPHLFVTELRTIAADNLWMSTAYQRDSLAIHFTWKPEWDAVKQILPQIEAQLKPFNPRPHWAKLFTIPPQQLQAQYTRLADFKAFVNQHDPSGKFRNDFIDTNLYKS